MYMEHVSFLALALALGIAFVGVNVKTKVANWKSTNAFNLGTVRL